MWRTDGSNLFKTGKHNLSVAGRAPRVLTERFGPQERIARGTEQAQGISESVEDDERSRLSRYEDVGSETDPGFGAEDVSSGRTSRSRDGRVPGR